MTAHTWAAIALWALVPLAAWAATCETYNLARVRQIRNDLDEWGDHFDAQIDGVHRRLEQQPAPPPPVVHAITDAPPPTGPMPAARPRPTPHPRTTPAQALITVPAITEPPDDWAARTMDEILANLQKPAERPEKPKPPRKRTPRQPAPVQP